MFEANPIIGCDLKEISSADLPWELLKGKTILVTGGGGFLAAYFIKSLLIANDLHGLKLKVSCIARNQKSVRQRLYPYLDCRSLQVFEHDVTNPLPVNFPRADIIVHAASQASPKYYGIDPVGTLAANSIGTFNMLDHAVKGDSERFLFFSSGEIYGLVNKFPIAESDYGYLDPMDVRSCYAESKRVGETMCVSYARQYNLHVNIVRPFHTYGPDISLDDGRVFADFISDVIAHREIILRSDGLARRAFCYVSDATIGFLTVLLLGEKSEAYNIGNPHAEISIRDLATLVAELLPEMKTNVRFMSRTSEDSYINSPVLKSCPSIGKAQKIGWEPLVSLEVGFRRTILSFL